MSINEERKQIYANVLLDILSSNCQKNDKCPASKTEATKFRVGRLPKIAIHEYLNRIVLYLNCSEECFVLALIYIERLTGRRKSFSVNSYNVHRLIFTSVMIAAKYFDDDHWSNADWGRVGGLSCKKVNELEREFLRLINFNVDVENEFYTAWASSLMDHWYTLSISQEFKFLSLNLIDNVGSSYASTVAVADMQTPISGCSQVPNGYKAIFKEPFISTLTKAICSDYGLVGWQHGSLIYSPSYYIPRTIQTRVLCA